MPVPATEERRFRFAQWEFPGRLGAPAGRYVVRRFAGDKVRFVIVVTEVPPSRRRRREPVAATRVTVVDAAALRDDATASGWLRTAAVGEEFEIFARFMAYHRVASADPFAPDADPARALVIRLGYGSGAQLAAGEWTEVRSVDVPVRERAAKRRSKHRPADRLAALLSGRDAVLACEELALRARADVARGRNHEAALQLEAAVGAALSELAGWVGVGDLGSRVEELRGHEPRVRAAAAAARVGTLDAAGLEHVSAALERLEAALRARAIYAAEDSR